MRNFLLETVALTSLISLFLLYIFFASDYSFTLLAEKERHLDELKSKFLKEQNENDFLTRREAGTPSQKTVLSDYGYIKPEEILIDLQIPPHKKHEPDLAKSDKISLSTFLFIIGIFIALFLNLIYFYRRKKLGDLRPSLEPVDPRVGAPQGKRNQ